MEECALSSSVVVSPSDPCSLVSSSGKLPPRISIDFCFHSDTSCWDLMGSSGTGTGTVTRRLVGSSGAVARGSVLLKVTMVSLPIGLRGASSSTSTLALFKLPREVFSRCTGRFSPSRDAGDVISSLLSEALPLL